MKNIIATMEYPGRIVGIGKYDTKIILTYCVTARNEASRAKRYLYDKEFNIIIVQTTDIDIMSRGNLDLLQYTSTYFCDDAVIVGNGRQTDSIKNINKPSAKDILESNLKDTLYEPDDYCTPRVTGCVLKSKKKIPQL